MNYSVKRFIALTKGLGYFPILTHPIIVISLLFGEN